MALIPIGNLNGYKAPSVSMSEAMFGIPYLAHGKLSLKVQNGL